MFTAMFKRFLLLFTLTTLVVLSILCLTGCVHRPTPNPVNFLEPTAGEVTIRQESLPSPSPTLESIPLPEPGIPASLSPQPTPEAIINGGVVQDGPFTFFVWLFQDPSFNPEPATTSLYSDLSGYGVYLFWVYQGPGLPGPVTEWVGVEPNLQELNTYANLKANDQGGRSGGVLLPGGFYIPGQSSPGDRLRLVIELVTGEGTYGAALPFTLQQAPQGWQPGEVGVALALEETRARGSQLPFEITLLPTPQAQAEAWSSLYGAEDPGRAAWVAFSGQIERGQKGNLSSLRFDYPAEWVITDTNPQHIAVQSIPLASPPPSGQSWAKLEVVYLKTPPTFEAEILPETVHTVTIAGISAVLIDHSEAITVIFSKDGAWYSVAGYMGGGDQADVLAFRSTLLQMMASLDIF